MAAPAALRERVVWLQRDACQIHLLREPGAVAPASGHAALVVADYEETIAAIARAGHPLQERAAYWGSRRSFARDPAGHTVEIMAFTPR